MTNETEQWKNPPRLLRYGTKGVYGIRNYYKVPGSGTDEEGFFVFTKAQYNHVFDAEESTENEAGMVSRCDEYLEADIPRPVDIHEINTETGICDVCGDDSPVFPTTNSHYASLSNTNTIRMPFQGYAGFIAYLKINNTELEETAVYRNTNVARTLQEMFKLMLEWEWVYLNIDENDIQAKLAHDILDELEMPEEIRDWVWNNVPDMHVAKYLKGDTDARLRPTPTSVPDMHPDFEAWCYYKITKSPTIWNATSR